MRLRAPKTRAPSSYKETIYERGAVKITFQLATFDADPHRARDEILVALVRYLAEDPTVRILLAEDPEKANAFLGGLIEAVNGRIDPEAWTGDAGEIAALLLREAARRGMAGLYLASGRDSMSTATM